MGQRGRPGDVDLLTPRPERADEEDLVHSGLEETLAGAYPGRRETARERDTDLRTASALVAIDKIANIYRDRGSAP